MIYLKESLLPKTSDLTSRGNLPRIRNNSSKQHNCLWCPTIPKYLNYFGLAHMQNVLSFMLYERFFQNSLP